MYHFYPMNRKVPVFMFASLSATLLGGCNSSPQMRRIDRNRDIYETWPIDTRQAVLDGKVEPGMTPDMVKVAWGDPSEVVSQGGPGDEVWVYKKGGSDGSVYYPGGMNSGIGMGSPGIGIATGRGGTAIGATGGIGMGVPIGGMGGMGGGIMGGGMGGGMGGPIITPPTPAEVREVVFRNGVVFKADTP
jgi:hypothetical protein